MSRVRLHGLKGKCEGLNGEEAIVLSRIRDMIRVRVVDGPLVQIPAGNARDVTLPGEVIDAFARGPDGPATPRPNRKLAKARVN